MFKRYILAGFLFAAGSSILFLSTLGQTHVQAQQGKTPLAPQIVKLVGFAETAPARTFPAGKSIQADQELIEQKHEMNEKNTEHVRPSMPGPSFDASIDAQTKNASKVPSHLSDIWTKAVPSSNSPSAPSIYFTFEGIPVQNSAPPDTNADVGPNDIVETVNTLVQVFDKSGNPRGPAFTQSSLFQAVGGVCAITDDGDPIVQYDRLADRWVISQFGFLDPTVPPYHECVAVSKSPDPMGAYYVYDFQLPGNEFPDYPKFGVWPDGYYMTTNQFYEFNNFDGVGVFAWNRAKMLVGDHTGILGIYFNLNLSSFPEGIYGMLPSDHDGILPPPAGAPNVFTYFTNVDFGDPADGLRLFNFIPDFVNNPGNTSTFAESQTTYNSPLPLAAFDGRSPNSRDAIEQPPPAGNNSTDRLDSVGEHLMYRLQYMNLNGVEYLVSNLTVNVSGQTPNSAASYQAGVRYFQLVRYCPSCDYSVNEQSTLAFGPGNGPTGDNAWMASAAMDNSNNIAVGSSISGVQITNVPHSPSLEIATRNYYDAPNGLSSAQLLWYGPGVQRGTANRWGDYSSMMVDPSDDCTFWYANEYYTSTNLTFNWQTRIGAFRMPYCYSPPQGTLSGTITACDSGAPLSFATVQVSNGFSTTTSEVSNGNYSVQLAPGDYTVTVIDPDHSCNAAGAFNVTINDGQTTTLNACLSGVADPIVDPNDPSLEVVTGGNGNGVIDADECNMLTVTAKNVGCAPARNVTAVLSTSTSGVTITQPNSTYVNMPVDGSASNTTPFKVSTAPGFVCGTPIDFTLTINFTGGSEVSTFSLPTCTETKPPQSFSGSLAAGDSVQTGRLSRTGIPSSCAGKSCPGLFITTPPGGAGQTAPHLYDKYNFVNGPLSACVTITLNNNTSNTNNPLLAKAYLGSYDPIADPNMCTNYLGDEGGSATTGSFQVTVPANATLVVVVEESGNGSTVPPFTAPTNYSGSVTGLSAAPIDGGGICKFSPTISTVASPNLTHLGAAISDTATLSGGSSPTGTITFRLFGPNQATCGGALVYMSTKSVSGGTATADPFYPTTPGTYRWIANYNGDSANNPVAGMCNDANESVVVLPKATSVVGSGTINGPNGGQASFTLNAAFKGKGGKATGQVDYTDPVNGFSMTTPKITSLSFSGDCAHITGTGKIGKTKVSFSVDVCDIAPPGTDSFSISLSNGYSANGNLTGGQIMFH